MKRRTFVSALALMATSLLPVSAYAATYLWTPVAAGAYTWNNASMTDNWGSGPGGPFPNAINDVAIVTVDVDGTVTISLEQPITLGMLTAGDTNLNQAIAIQNGSGGSLEFKVSSGNASLTKILTNGLVTVSADIILTSDLTVANNGGTAPLTLTGAISGSGNLTLGATSTTGIFLAPSTPSTYTGLTEINGTGNGYPRIGKPSALGSTGIGTVVRSGGRLFMGDASFSPTNMTFNPEPLELNGGALWSFNTWTPTWTGAITLTANSALKVDNAGTMHINPPGVNAINLQSFTLTIAGRNIADTAPDPNPSFEIHDPIVGTGGITWASGNTLTLSAANTFSGVTLVSTAVTALALNDVNALQNSTLDTGSSGTQQVTFVVAGNNTYNIGGLQGNDDLNIGGNTISVGANNTSTAYGGAISGTGGLQKGGNGELRLTSISTTYLGATNIGLGSIRLDGNHVGGADYEIFPGGSLTGTGTTNAGVNVSGFIVPGSPGPGKLTVGTSTWNNGGHFQFYIDDANGSIGSDPGFANLRVNGAFDIGGLTTGGFTIHVGSVIHPMHMAGDAANFDYRYDYAWPLVTFDSLSGSFDPNNFVLDTSGFTNPKPTGTFGVEQIGNFLVLTWNALNVCGNGFSTSNEECDDGNFVDGDGCDSDCSLTACGNGILTTGEACDDGNLINGDGCDLSCRHEIGLACAAGAECTSGFCVDAICCSVVACTALDQCHIPGTCQAGTGQCDNPPIADGSSCDDNDACTQMDTCQSGTCVPGMPLVCTAMDQCHDAGTCDSMTGLCNNPTKTDGSLCDDNDACTQMDSCQSGTCVPAMPVVCTAMDQCHDVGTCDSMTGLCNNPTKSDGSLCDDNDACTQMDSCQSGKCVAAMPIVCPAVDTCHDVGTCDSTIGLCSNPTMANGTTCLQGNAEGSCQEGVCIITIACNTDTDCPPLQTCSADHHCIPVTDGPLSSISGCQCAMPNDNGTSRQTIGAILFALSTLFARQRRAKS